MPVAGAYVAAASFWQQERTMGPDGNASGPIAL
jgi:hypothetical protein